MTFLPPFSPDSSILSSVFSPTRPKNCKNLLRKKSRNSDFIQVHWGGAYLQCYQPTFCQFYMPSSIKKLVPLHGQSWQHCLEGRWCIVLRKKTAACILLAKILSFNSQKDVLPISWSISVVERMRKNVFLLFPSLPVSSSLSSAFSATSPRNCNRTYKVSLLINGRSWIMCCKCPICSWMFFISETKQNRQSSQ